MKCSICQVAATHSGGTCYAFSDAGLVQKTSKIRFELIPELISVNHDPVYTYWVAKGQSN